MMKIDSESGQPKRIHLSDYKAPAFKVEKIDLVFEIDERATLVHTTQIVEKIEEESLVLDGENLLLKSISIDGRSLNSNEFSLSAEMLTIPNTPKKFKLETVVEINPSENKSCEGLYLSRGIFATQCEAEGFRHITYFLDRPDVMTSYNVTIRADKKNYPVLLSNGDLISTRDLEGGRHEAVWFDPHKKPSYLFALVAGDLGVIRDTYTTGSGKKVTLEVYASHGKQHRCHHALESLKKAMKWDEERFGLEYDLGQYMIVSIDDFNMGAMENKGLNIFNSRLVLADPESATDTDFERIESVVGHEYFHNWTGNRVTCRNWFELSLKEGLTVFRDQEFSSDLNSRAVQRIKDVDALRGSQFSEDAGPNAHPVRPESCLSVDNFYTSTIYEKGSEVIRMMQTIVGRKVFRLGMDEYFKRHDGQAVTILNFADAIAAPNSADFSQFKFWYSQAGTPDVHVTESYDSQAQQYTLTLEQKLKPTDKQSSFKAFHIPLLIGLLDSKGKNIQIQSTDVKFNSDEKPVVHLKQLQQTFVFSNVNEKPVLSLNREFSAPIRLHWDAKDNELIHLIKYDSDEFNRREALYKMTLSELRRLIASARIGNATDVSKALIEALGYVLNDSKIDAQFKALMLQLPANDVLAQEEETLDAFAFQLARSILVKGFVDSYSAELLIAYRTHHAGNTIGDRALKNAILGLLIEANPAKYSEIAVTQFNQAKNMTDTLGALARLCEVDGPEKDNALKTFFNKWKDDAVVFNKWLTVQAVVEHKSTFNQVVKLAETPPFSLENPNNIYSLLGAFGENYLAQQANPSECFKWLCDKIIQIDKNNPQAAARVCSSFNFVNKFAEPSRTAALDEIKKMLAVKELSSNSRELLETLV